MSSIPHGEDRFRGADPSKHRVLKTPNTEEVMRFVAKVMGYALLGWFILSGVGLTGVLVAVTSGHLSPEQLTEWTQLASENLALAATALFGGVGGTSVLLRAAWRTVLFVHWVRSTFEDFKGRFGAMEAHYRNL